MRKDTPNTVGVDISKVRLVARHRAPVKPDTSCALKADTLFVRNTHAQHTRHCPFDQ